MRYRGKTVGWITLKFDMMKECIKKNISSEFRKNPKNEMALVAILNFLCVQTSWRTACMDHNSKFVNSTSLV